MTEENISLAQQPESWLLGDDDDNYLDYNYIDWFAEYLASWLVAATIPSSGYRGQVPHDEHVSW